jgi:choice-of-anchor C domain-containing protein
VKALNVLTIALSLNALVFGTAHALPFQNGSFEIGPNPGPGFVTLWGGNTAITGWQVIGRNIDYVSNTYWSAAHGSRSLDLNGFLGGAGIRQTFDTIAGTQYHVQFAMAGNPESQFPPARGLRVTVDSTSSIYSFPVAGAGHSNFNMGWLDHNFHFTALGASSTLEFYSLTPLCCWGPALDNVRVTALGGPSNSLPAPGVAVLLSSGLAGLGAWRWRTRRRPV